MIDTHSKAGRNQKIKLGVAIIGIALVVAAISGYAVYQWQQDKIESSSADKRKLQEKVNSLQTKTLDIEKKFENASKELSEKLKEESMKAESEVRSAPAYSAPPKMLTQSDLTLSINKAVRFNPSGIEGHKETGVGVELTVSNKTDTALPISIVSLQIQDGENHTYQIIPSLSSTYLPTGYVSLLNQTINPGQTAKGWVTFHVTDVSPTTFVLFNGSKTYAFKTD